MPKRARKKHVKTKKRLVPLIFFMIILTGTCLFLYSTAVPDMAGSATLDSAGREEAAGQEALGPSVRAMAAEAKVEVYGNIISATGVGRVPDGTAQGRLLGRRAAITDARRNLLAHRQKLALGAGVSPSGTASVSGLLAGAQRIKSEGVRDGVYFVELEMRLDDLLRSNFDESRFVNEYNDIL